jgi:hypothetical protein
MLGDSKQDMDIAKEVAGGGESGGIEKLEQAVWVLWQSWFCIIENMIA